MTPVRPVPPPASRDVPAPAWRGAVAGLLLALVAIKLAGLLADPVLRFFMGDSGSYLHTALTGWRPSDRSYTYGLLVGATAVAAGSPLVLLGLQALAGVATALSLAWLLARAAALRPAIAATAALLLAVEPAQLFYERMLMAESAGTLAFVLQVCALAAYARDGRLRWLLPATVAGLAAVSFRLSLLPVVLGLAATVPVVVALAHAPAGRRSAALARHAGVALALTVVLHAAYQAGYRRDYGESTYLPANGMMRIGLVAPLVRASHFEGTGVDGARVLAEVGQPLADPRRRELHIWSADGLYLTLARHSKRPEAVARVVASRALREAPLDWVALGMGNVGDYFDAGLMRHRLEDDLGRRAPDERMLAALREHLGYDARGVAASSSAATHWFSLGAPWLVAGFLLLAPLALLALRLHWRSPARAVVAVVCLASLGLVASHLLFAHIPSLRYLHPMPWFVLANLALVAGALARRRGDQGPDTAR